MIALDEKRIQDLTSFVYQYIIKHLIPSLEQDKDLTEQDINVVKMMASVCSVAAPAVITFLNDLEAAEQAPKARLKS